MSVDLVVKLGGGLLDHERHLTATLRLLASASRTRRLLVVPGGGPFADAVRDADARLGLSASAAHWMAILAMDQHAHLLVDRLESAVLVHGAAEIDAALEAARIPVLAPFRWLRSADPLPHSWDVTSDSIAAWVAGALGAPRLLLIKPPCSSGDVVDAYFTRALPSGVTARSVAADRLDECAALR
jgi:5-(aminomethyl)-3-furanmethanol phosphate kinase